MANEEDKKTIIVEKANKIEEMKKADGWSVLTEVLAETMNQYRVEEAIDWADFKFRLGVQKGLSLLEEITSVVIATADRIKRGKKNF